MESLEPVHVGESSAVWRIVKVGSRSPIMDARPIESLRGHRMSVSDRCLAGHSDVSTLRRWSPGQGRWWCCRVTRPNSCWGPGARP